MNTIHGVPDALMWRIEHMAKEHNLPTNSLAHQLMWAGLCSMYSASNTAPTDESKVTLSDAGLSMRARKILVRFAIKYVGEIARLTEDDLLEARNCGITTFNEIKDKLNDYGLKLRK